MSKIRQRISEFRNSLPKRVQWLLLIVALVIVVIFLTLMLSRNASDKINIKDTQTVQLNITPNKINWTDVLVGQKREEKIIVSSQELVKITDGGVFSDSI